MRVWSLRALDKRGVPDLPIVHLDPPMTVLSGSRRSSWSTKFSPPAPALGESGAVRAPPLSAPAPLSRRSVGDPRVGEGSDGRLAHSLGESVTPPVVVEATRAGRGPVDLTDFIALAQRMSIPTDEAIRQFVGVNIVRRGGRGEPDGRDLTLTGLDAGRHGRLCAGSSERTRGHGADGRTPDPTQRSPQAR